jgi:hypothetical protein
MGCGNMNRMYPAQNSVQRWVVVNNGNRLAGSVKDMEFLEQTKEY